MPDIEQLKLRLRRFAEERDWEKFHSPKNLAMALSAEVGELLEHFQWLTEEQSAALDSDKRGAVEAELADVFIYLVRLSDRLDIDLLEAVAGKIEANEEKYPVDQVYGSSKKYTEYD